MAEKVKVVKISNSNAIRFPFRILRDLGIATGDELELAVYGETIVLSKEGATRDDKLRDCVQMLNHITYEENVDSKPAEE